MRPTPLRVWTLVLAAGAAAALALQGTGCQVPPLEEVAGDKSCDEDAGHPCALGYLCCGGACVTQDAGCCLPENDLGFCTRLGKTCDLVSDTDNCGKPRTANCGSCTGSASCGAGGVENLCGIAGCASETTPAFCTRLGKMCGTVTANDSCGVGRSVSCGACTSPATCHADNICRQCTPESDAAFCTRFGKQCASYTNADNCGDPRTVNCGSCTTAPNLTCSAGNVCVCTPETDAQLCARLSVLCGTANGLDNCGTVRTASCPMCPAPETCGGGGAAGQCGCIAVGSNGCLDAGVACCDGICNGTGRCCRPLGDPCTGVAGECCMGICNVGVTDTCCRATGVCSDDSQCCGYCNTTTNQCESP